MTEEERAGGSCLRRNDGERAGGSCLRRNDGEGAQGWRGEGAGMTGRGRGGMTEVRLPGMWKCEHLE